MPLFGVSKIYNNGESPSWILKGVANQYFYLRTGVVEYVDVDKYQMVIRWEPGDGVRENVQIPFAYAGPAGCLGMLPEKGSIGVFGFTGPGSTPLCVGFLPTGLDAGLNNNEVKIYPDSIPTSDVNKIQFKFRKLTLGDMIMRSPLGGTVFLNEDVEIHDNARDSIVIREADQSIIQTSLNHFVFADGVSINSGPAIRNTMVLYDQEGEKIPNNGSLLSLPNGKDNIYIVPQGEDIVYDTPYYTEYRVDVDEMGDGKLDSNDINSMSPLSTRNPLATLVLGNFIGADKMNEQTYGKILKASLFDSGNSQVGNFALTEASDKNGVNEPRILALAYALYFKKTECFLGVDKEGHYYMNLPGSQSEGAMGAGRSMSILAAGNLKEIWGAEATDANSWDLTTTGGIRWNIGSHGPTNFRRSIDIKTERGIYIKANGTDSETREIGGRPWQGFSKQEIYDGNVYEAVGAGKAVNVAGEFSTKISGLKEDVIDGASMESIQGNKIVSVGDSYTETVTKEKQGRYGSRKTFIGPKGNDELEVMAGDLVQTITTFGQRKASFQGKGGVFNIKETIGNNVHETEMLLGAYRLKMGIGKFEIKAPQGTVTLEGSTVTINGKIMAKIDSSIVKLGSGALIGGVVSGLPGKPSHADYTTGAPHKGSFKVSVG